MKKFFLLQLLLFAFLFSFAQVNVTISGTVTNTTNGAPIANQTVYIMADSSNILGFGYFGSAVTNASGVYTDIVYIPNGGPGYPVTFYVYTYDCNQQMHSGQGTSTGQPITVDFTLCNTAPPCNASFTYYQDTSLLNSIYFINTSTGSSLTYLWYFSTGTQSNLQNPVITFPQPGTYTACLFISGPNGCQDSACMSVTVSNYVSCYAYFNGSASPSNNLDIIFQNYSGASTTSWLWYFGDSTSSTLQNPTHLYAAAGNYQVCLTAYGPNGCQNTYCSYVSAGGASGCQAYFYYYPDSSGTTGVSFSDYSQGNPTAWAWTFGDGGTSNLQYPYHLYNSPGTYNVCLTISGPNGCQDTYCDSVVAGPYPSYCYNYASYSVNLLVVTFAGYAYGGTAPYTYSWDFGDAATSTLQNPVHTYVSAGNYFVTLTTTDALGCTYVSSYWVNAGTSTPCYLYGQISANGQYLDNGFALLYGVSPVLGTYIVDSILVDSAGHYWFNNVQPGTYIIKALPSPNSVFYTTYLPTYYGNTPFWMSATQFTVPPAVNSYDIQLALIIGPQSGSGTISGTITNGFKLASGSPASGVEVVLTNPGNQALAVDYTDVAGLFSFSNLAYGTYKLNAEVTGKTSSPVTVTLSAGNPSSTSTHFYITSSGITTGIPAGPTSTQFNINKLYPNPAKEVLNIEISSDRALQISIDIYDLLGQKVIQQSINLVKGANTINLNTASLNSGVYSLQLITSDGKTINQKLSITR